MMDPLSACNIISDLCPTSAGWHVPALGEWGHRRAERGRRRRDGGYTCLAVFLDDCKKTALTVMYGCHSEKKPGVTLEWTRRERKDLRATSDAKAVAAIRVWLREIGAEL